MIKKKLYNKPEITRIALDISICLMQTSPGPPPNPTDPRTAGKKGSEPFQSPFGDKPFN